MRHFTTLVLAFTVTVLPAVATADVREDAKAQVDFGIAVARKGLWKEAQYRWERATQIDPSYAAAFNNLAVAFEQQGNFEKAREAYEKAVQLEPNNLQIKQNFDLFKEINDRSNRAEDR
jgi:Tfp pilus assembly protein PilF